MLNQAPNDGTDREWGTGDSPAKWAQAWRKPFEPTSSEIVNLKLESPEPKQVRISYAGSDWEAGNVYLLWLEVIQSIDSSVVRQRQLVPWQGAAISIPAGAAQIILTGKDGYNANQDVFPTNNVAQIQVSAGLPGLNQRRQQKPDVSTGYSDGWYLAQASATRVYPPLFATSMVVHTFGPDLLTIRNIKQGFSVTMAANTTAELPIPDPGYFLISSGPFAYCAFSFRVSA